MNNSKITNNFGTILRELRSEKDLTQQELAIFLSTSQDTISLWERGKSLPDFVSIIKMTEIFEVSADYLLGISEHLT